MIILYILKRYSVAFSLSGLLWTLIATALGFYKIALWSLLIAIGFLIIWMRNQ